MPYVWKTSLSDGPRGASLYRGFTIADKGVVYIGKRKSTGPLDASYLGLKDFVTGKDVWRWDGFFNQVVGQSIRDHLVVSDNKILINDLQATYVVDGLTGNEIWKTQRIGSVSAVTEVAGSYFISANAPDFEETRKEQDMVYQGRLSDKGLHPLIKPPYSDEFAKWRGDYIPFGYLLRQKAFLRDGDQMLIIPYEEMGPEGKFTPLRSLFGLYNVSKGFWVYDRIPLSFEEDGSSQSVMPIVTEDKVYLTSLATVGCYELETGRRLWQKTVTDVHTGISDMLLVGNKLIVNVHNAEMHCLDASGGRIYWTQKSSGISSDMYHQDGVVYWIPSKSLRAVDIESGKLLWDVPTMDKEGDSHWWGFVTGVPGMNGEKGKIYATSNLYMYCFDAAK